MISRILLVAGPVAAIATDSGALQTVKDVLLIAFLAIGAVWLIVDIRRNLAATYGSAEPLPAPQPTPATTSPAARVAGERPSPELLAVIAAAVHSTLGRDSRIIAISGEGDDVQSWAAEGRRAIYATRKVR